MGLRPSHPQPNPMLASTQGLRPAPRVTPAACSHYLWVMCTPLPLYPTSSFCAL